MGGTQQTSPGRGRGWIYSRVERLLPGKLVIFSGVTKSQIDAVIWKISAYSKKKFQQQRLETGIKVTRLT